MTEAPYPRPGEAMMTARKAAFDEPPRPKVFDRDRFHSQPIAVNANDLRGERRTGLVDRIIDSVSTGPEGAGIGYCLLRGFSALMPVEGTRAASIELLTQVWEGFRARSPRISQSRDFSITDTLTHDGAIPLELFGSRWSFKPPHADRNGVVFAHVYGPSAGFHGGDVVLIDALAYASSRDLSFEDVCSWSDDVGDKKPVLRAEHAALALAGFGRNLGKLGPDEVLFVNNGPDGIFHGASELFVLNESDFVRVLHRCVAKEQDP